MDMAGLDDRKYWIEVLISIADPVLQALSKGKLKETMHIEQKTEDRSDFTYLEALGRTLVGIAPWLELGNSDDNGKDLEWEGSLRMKYAQLSRAAIDVATDPDSADYMNFSKGMQPIVDAAFLSHALLRAPYELWEKLDGRVKKNLINALKETRRNRKPCFTNWLLFSGVIEAALYKMGEEWDHMRVDYCIKQFEQWYLGDGIYSDGIDYHWDYYNSLVIQPMLLDILLTVGDFYGEWRALKEPVLERSRRYASILEMLISPEGTYPLTGRSITYRFGIFQTLGQMALMHQLPDGVSPSRIRCALTSVIKRTMAFDNFDKNGWLKIGVCGSQPDLGEGYISTGSLYLCTAGLLPLGLPAGDEFWTGNEEPWISKRLWSGENLAADHAI